MKKTLCLITTLLIVSILMAACDDPGANFGRDAARNAGVNAGPDIEVRAGVDAGLNAGRNAGADVDVKAGVEVNVDAGVNAGVNAGRNAGVDVDVDAGVSTGLDPRDYVVEGVDSLTLFGIFILLGIGAIVLAMSFVLRAIHFRKSN